MRSINLLEANIQMDEEGNAKLRERVSDAVRKTVNKFREDPYVFFTETDLHAYLYRCLYSKKLEAKTKDGALTACVHKEHPANFRCSKKTMKDYRFEKKGARGHSIDRGRPPHSLKPQGRAIEVKTSSG